MKISEYAELYYLQRYQKKTKRVEPVGEEFEQKKEVLFMYKYEKRKCELCGKMVADNWGIRHWHMYHDYHHLHHDSDVFMRLQKTNIEGEK